MSDTQHQPSGVAGDTGSGANAPGQTRSPSPPPYLPLSEGRAKRTGWSSWVTFACIMMILTGAFQAISGLVALFDDTYYLVTSGGLVVEADYTTWGWVHLIIGALIILAGFAALRGALWARIVGVTMAGLSALANLAFLAAYPLWSVLVIAMDVIIIYALTVHGSERAS